MGLLMSAINAWESTMIEKDTFCPLCRESECIVYLTRRNRVGYSLGKIALAGMTMGLSLVFVGVSRYEWVEVAYCQKCRNTMTKGFVLGSQRGIAELKAMHVPTDAEIQAEMEQAQREAEVNVDQWWRATQLGVATTYPQTPQAPAVVERREAALRLMELGNQFAPK